MTLKFPHTRIVDGLGVIRLRQRMGLSRDKFGHFLGVSGQTIAKWESGIHIIPQTAQYAIAHLLQEKPLPEYWLLRRAGRVDVVEKHETESVFVEQVHFDLKRNIYLFRELALP